MGKGKALRRRAKLVEAATHGNLHKAQKGKASKMPALPAAPSAKDMEDKMPASLRKMMLLKTVAETHRQKNKNKFAVAAKGAGVAASQAPAASLGLERVSSSSGRPSDVEPLPGSQAPAQSPGQQQKQQQPQRRDPSLPVFEQPRKLKQRKKDYLNAKKLKKKKGKKGAEEFLHEKERQVDKVRFGETVHQPLKVHLKRKHWDAATAEKPEQARCKRVFLSQMHRAEQQQQQQQQGFASKLAARSLRQVGKQQKLRDEVIEAYRAKRSQPAEGRATLGSLKTLVTQ